MSTRGKRRADETASLAPLSEAFRLAFGSAPGSDRRVMLLGQPGVGKSTLARGLAVQLHAAGRSISYLSADPGSPPFGIPGAVCLGDWTPAGWSLRGLEALCTLDAGRFRLPLVSAVRALAALWRYGQWKTETSGQGL